MLWNKTLNAYLLDIGLKRAKSDLCLYSHKSSIGILFLLIWVDDIIIMGSNSNIINHIKHKLKSRFQIKDHGELKFFLGVQFKFTRNRVTISQEHYVDTILKRFNMQNCKKLPTPCVQNLYDELKAHANDPPLENPTLYRELVGSLLYLQQVSRPDISFIVNILSRFMSKPTKYTWELGKKVLRYLQGSRNFCLNYYKSEDIQLQGMCDADYARAMNRKSISGYVYVLNEQSSPISWSSKRQKLTSLSTCNSEFIALSAAVCECLWLQSLLDDINIPEIKYRPANLFSDSQSACDLARKPCSHDSNKHIDVKMFHVRDHVEYKTVILDYINTDDNFADIFTKPVTNPKMEKMFLRLQGLH